MPSTIAITLSYLALATSLLQVRLALRFAVAVLLRTRVNRLNQPVHVRVC